MYLLEIELKYPTNNEMSPAIRCNKCANVNTYKKEPDGFEPSPVK